MKRSSSKPLSSPGRTEKFPPPLMRFLRSNVGSRSSRARSRASPMFVRKKNNNNTTTAATETTQEPSSPKVTCMGQVRVKRSSKQSKTRRRHPKRRCRWVPNAMFCAHFSQKIKEKSFRPHFKKWAMFIQMGFGRKAENSSKNESSCKENGSSCNKKYEESEEEEDEEGANNKFVNSSFTPPKNALLLTRCRSAPYRSSSLASRFWGSPLNTEEEREQKTEQETEQVAECINREQFILERESVSRDSNSESINDLENEETSELSDEFEGSIDEKSTKSAKVEELKTGKVCFARPLMLTRCKSEPARTGNKLDPEAVT